jgi:hypothetical protein
MATTLTNWILLGAVAVALIVVLVLMYVLIGRRRPEVPGRSRRVADGSEVPSSTSRRRVVGRRKTRDVNET